MKNLNTTLSSMTSKVGSAFGAISIFKGHHEETVQYSISATYVRCPRIHWWTKKIAFWIAVRDLQKDSRIQVQLSFSPRNGLLTVCDHGKIHSDGKVFNATLRIESSHAEVLSELQKFEEAIKYSYYSCYDLGHELAAI